MKALKLLSRIRNSKISDTAKIYPFSVIKNTLIDDYTYISYNCVINNCTIGRYCSIAKDVKIGLGIHPTTFISTSPIFYSTTNPLGVTLVQNTLFKETESTYIGNDVWIGANAVILDGIKIGNGAIVGANALVNKDVEPYTIVGGVPAKVIKKRFSDTIISRLEQIQWWNFPINKLSGDRSLKIFTKVFEEGDLEDLEEILK
ncbi:hypothetical protein BV902_02260 [Sphingobacterium sp. B29]|uniref:CatB-related O-acetyltransferase n=1 Tax=Sphingobacterium sp. B29 TaxID=1933220 RepID=UPI00095835C9|nr:hypothetical protein BV902_02260 [Sphingobacterium sp. B29]